MAQKYWFEIPEHFSFVKLDEFVFMRNHINGIIEIAKTNDEWGNVTERGNVSGRDDILKCNDVSGMWECIGTRERIGNVKTQNFASLQSPQSLNLASIIRDIKLENWPKNIGLKYRNIFHL